MAMHISFSHASTTAYAGCKCKKCNSSYVFSIEKSFTGSRSTYGNSTKAMASANGHVLFERYAFERQTKVNPTSVAYFKCPCCHHKEESNKFLIQTKLISFLYVTLLLLCSFAVLLCVIFAITSLRNCAWKDTLLLLAGIVVSIMCTKFLDKYLVKLSQNINTKKEELIDKSNFWGDTNIASILFQMRDAGCFVSGDLYICGYEYYEYYNCIRNQDIQRVVLNENTINQYLWEILE